MIRRLLFALASLILASLITSCATIGNDFSQTLPSDITEAEVQAEPSFWARKDKTFTIIPASLFFEKPKLDVIDEQYLILYVRSIMEAKGFSYVLEDNNADIVITFDSVIKYRTTYVPPSQLSFPKYEPGGMSTTYGSIGMDSFSATTHNSGKWTSETITTGGYETGNYYALTRIWVYDGVTKKNIWNGSAIGTGQESDVRVANLGVISQILDKFPDQSEGTLFNEMLGRGGLGFKYTLWTFDGNQFFPVVLELQESAKQAGILTNDIILAVDDESVINMPLYDTWKKIKGRPGTTARVDIFSRGEKRRVSLIRVD